MGTGRRTTRVRARDRRRLARQNGPSDPVIKGGLSGGLFKPLSDAEVSSVHQAVLEVLETVGVGDPSRDLLDLMLPKGCFLSPENRICFPRGLVEDMLNCAASEFQVYARGSRSPDWDVHIGGNRVYYGIGAESVLILDPETRRYRQTTITDLYDLSRVIDTLDNVHIAGQMAQPSDIEDFLDQDINTIYAIAAATEKPFSMSFRAAKNISRGIEFFDALLGGEGRYLQRPFCTSGPITVIAPLRFDPDGLEVLLESVRHGLIIDASCGPMVGATGPASIAGTLVQATAEILASIVIVNLLRPGLPVIFGPWPFVADLRTGAFASGAGEGAILGAAMAQIGNYYGLPSSQGACMTDSKIPDAQAGYEKGISGVLAAQAGSNRIQVAAGSLGSIKCCAHEALIIDNDMIGVALRTIRGFDMDDTALSVEVIRQATLGIGHYLGHAQTLSLMESHFHYPKIADRNTPDVWESEGSPTVYDRSCEKATEILKNHFPRHISQDLDQKIRSRWRIFIPPSSMNKTSA